MKTLKKFAAVLLLIAALCPVLVLYSAAADADIVWWSVYTGYEEGEVYKPFQVKGELKTGKNNVLVNDGCLRFNAESFGYYAIDITDPSGRGALFEVATIDSENKADNVFSTYGCCRWIDAVYDGKEFNGIIFFIEQPGTYYVRFSDEEYVDGRYVAEDIFACSADVRFLGDFVSASFGKDTLKLGPDIDSIWHESPEVIGCPCTFTFSDGNTYSGGITGFIDKLESGKRTITFNLSNGPDIIIHINLATILDSIEDVVLPDGYTPSRMFHFDPHELMPDSHSCDVTFIHPEYVELHFKDGTVKKATLNSNENWLENCNNFSCGGEDHYIYSGYCFYEDGKLEYSISIDNIDIYEKPVKNTVSRISDLKTYISEVCRLLKFIHFGSLDDTAESLKTVSGEIYNLTKTYIEYLRFIDGKNITAI